MEWYRTCVLPIRLPGVASLVLCVSRCSIPEISDVSISSPLEKGTREIGDPG